MSLEIDTGALRAALFATEPARTKTTTLYGLSPEFQGAELERALWATIGQAECDPEAVGDDASAVFRAAVWAIASGSRRWASFISTEHEIRLLVEGYDPAVAAAFAENEAEQLRKLLRGLTARRDTSAVHAWAVRLVAEPNYRDFLTMLRRAVAERIGVAVSEPEMTACVSLIIGAGLPSFGKPAKLKAPGMGPILASEFLRNLGWSGFKPDRHVQRLLSRWFDRDPAIESRAGQLAEAIGAKGRAVEDFLYYSLLGASRSPLGESVNKVDHLVWMFGSVVVPGTRPVPNMTRPRGSSQR